MENTPRQIPNDTKKDLPLSFAPANGSGPGVLLVDKEDKLDFLVGAAKIFAEEGYCASVLPINLSDEKLSKPKLINSVVNGLVELRNLKAQSGKVGIILYGTTGASYVLGSDKIKVDCAVSYCGELIQPDNLNAIDNHSVISHIIEGSGSINSTIKNFCYPDCSDRFFDQTDKTFYKPAASMAHSRTLTLLRTELGPIYDLSELWEKHTTYEFAERNVDKTMETMVQEPYVNHVPTMTGGVGSQHLRRFYKHHFVNSNPPDTKLIPVSRTIGIDRLVDEMIFCFTHTCEIPWMLPGIEPTGNYVEIPLVAIVNFRGDLLYHEHIYWDQASVLVQIGKLDPSGLPVAGIQTAKKLVDEKLPSNELMSSWAKSEFLVD